MKNPEFSFSVIIYYRKQNFRNVSLYLASGAIAYYY